MIVLIVQMQAAFAQSSVKGQVTDTIGTPLAGVSVLIKGAKKGASTDQQGNFSLAVKSGTILVFSSVGFIQSEQKVEEGEAVIVRMVPAATNVTEVVVTALGIKKEKRKLGFATQEVSGNSLEKAREANVLGSLSGKVAGLTTYSSGTLFENVGIYLRGRTPLIVVDGIATRGDSWNLNADDIENINVLKGPAAALLYGSIGSEGAIQITTRKGKAGANGVEVEFNETVQVQAGFLKLPKTQNQYGMGSGGQYAFIDGQGGGSVPGGSQWNDNYGYVYGPKLNQKASTSSGFLEVPQYNSPFDADNLFTFEENGITGQSHYKPMPLITRNQNNLKSFLRNELLNTINVNISGKSDKGNYRISLSHLYQKGQVPNTKLNSTTLNLAGSLKASDKVRIESNISYNRQYTPNYPRTGYGPSNHFYNILLWMGPEIDINDMRDYWKPAGGITTGSGFTPYGIKDIQQSTYNYTWYNNPWFIANEYLRGYVADVINAQASITYDVSKDLNLVVRSGGTMKFWASDLKTPYSFIDYAANKAPFGQYSIGKSSELRFVTDALLTYNKKFLSDFEATVTVGGSERYDHASGLSSSTTLGLNVPRAYSLSQSRGPVVSSNYLAEKEVRSVYGIVDLGYKNMVFLNLSGRNDWSSSLPKPNNSFFYPSASLGLVVSEMVKMPAVVSFVKLRGAWADIRTDFGAYATLPTYSTGQRWNSAPSLSLPGSVYADDIKPNRTISRELGLEAKFLKNRIGFDVAYFNYLEKDFLRQIPYSVASGYNSIWRNGDVLNRKGLEVVLNATPIKSKNLKWDILVNYSNVRNYIKEFYGGAEQRGLLKVGDRVNVDWQNGDGRGYNITGYKWQRSADGQIVYKDGHPQYVDQVVVLGLQEPDWEIGISNSFTYKNFNFSFQFDGRVGGKLYNGVEEKLYEAGNHISTANSYRDDAYLGNATYTGNGVVVTGGDVTYDFQGNITSDTRKFGANTDKVNYLDWVGETYNNGITEALLYKRTFIKLREVQLGYTFAPKILKKTPFKSANLSVVGRNLLLFTKVPYMDPDAATVGTNISEPSYRNIGINLNLKF